MTIAALGRKKAKATKKTEAATACLPAAIPPKRDISAGNAVPVAIGRSSEKWQKTRHAKAYDSLAAKGQQFNQDCLPCHVTGVVTGKEPYILTLPEALLQVGCEACHGPGRAHAAKSKSHPCRGRTSLSASGAIPRTRMTISFTGKKVCWCIETVPCITACITATERRDIHPWPLAPRGG